ncbi:uncharacterized protein LOC144112430 [Amblyomma americanum]
MFRRLPNGGNLKDVPVHSGVLEDQNEQTPTDELPGTPQQCVPLPKVTDSMETPAGRELSGISASSADDIVAGQHCHGTEHSPRHGDPVRSIPAGLAGLHVCMKHCYRESLHSQGFPEAHLENVMKSFNRYISKEISDVQKTAKRWQSKGCTCAQRRARRPK